MSGKRIIRMSTRGAPDKHVTLYLHANEVRVRVFVNGIATSAKFSKVFRKVHSEECADFYSALMGLSTRVLLALCNDGKDEDK